MNKVKRIYMGLVFIFMIVICIYLFAENHALTDADNCIFGIAIVAALIALIFNFINFEE